MPTHPHSPTPRNAAYLREWTGSTLLQVKACRRVGAKPFPEPTLTLSQLESYEQTLVKFKSNCVYFHSGKFIWNVVCNMAAILSNFAQLCSTKLNFVWKCCIYWVKSSHLVRAYCISHRIPVCLTQLWHSDGIWWHKYVHHWIKKQIAWRYRAITWANTDSSLVRFHGVSQKQVSKQLFCMMGLKIIPLYLLPHLTGVNELICFRLCAGL